MNTIITFKDVQHSPRAGGVGCGEGGVCQIHADEQITDTKQQITLRNDFSSLSSELTSDLGIVGHADSADPIVSHSCHLSCTPRSMPEEEEGDGDSLHTRV